MRAVVDEWGGAPSWTNGERKDQSAVYAPGRSHEHCRSLMVAGRGVTGVGTMWERHRDPQGWQGLRVQVHDGRALGVVVGVFVDGPLAGRLRVHGDYTPIRHGTGAQGGTAVYAIPCQAVVRQHRNSLVL